MARENRPGVWEVSQTPQLEDILKTFGRRVQLRIRTNTVGTVQAFDPATQTATVRVDILEVLKVLQAPAPPTSTPPSGSTDPNLSAKQVRQSPPVILVGIPVEIPGTSNDYLSFPIVPGTTGVLHVMDRGLQTWLSDIKDQAVDPVQSAVHALQDSVFVPALRKRNDPIVPPVDMTGTVLHSDTLIKLGRAATLGVARLGDSTTAATNMAAWMTLVTNAINTMSAQFNVSPAGTPVVSLGTGSVVPPGTAPADFGVVSTASTKTKAE